MIGQAPALSLHDFYADRFEPERLAHSSPATRKHYTQSIGRLDRYLGRPATFDDIAEETLGGLMAWLCQRKCKVSTLEETRRALHALYWAHAASNAPEQPEPARQPLGPETLLRHYVDVYEGKRTLRPGSIYQYQVAADCLDRWFGRPVAVGELTFDLVAAWIRHIVSSAFAPATARNRRQHLLTLWRSAHSAGLCASNPLGLPTVPLPWVPPKAWTYEEVQKLLGASEGLKGHYPKFPAQSQRIIRRSTFWGLLIRLAWDTGLRTGDIMALRLQQIDDEGTVEVVQGKTRRHHLTRIHPETHEAIRASFPPTIDTIIPWYMSREYHNREFRAIVQAARIGPGTFKKLRKSSGSEVEMLFPGCGGAHLGHAMHNDISRMHYLDPRLIIGHKPMPRPLREIGAKGGAQ